MESKKEVELELEEIATVEEDKEKEDQDKETEDQKKETKGKRFNTIFHLQALTKLLTLLKFKLTLGEVGSCEQKISVFSHIHVNMLTARVLFIFFFSTALSPTDFAAEDVEEGNIYTTLASPSEHEYGVPSSARSYTVNKGNTNSFS